MRRGGIMMQRTVDTPMGEIAFELQYKKVKNINLRIVKGGAVRVSAPRAASLAIIDSFVKSKAELILRAIDRLSTVQPSCSYADGETVFLLGLPYTLRCAAAPSNRAVISDGEITLYLKRGADESVRRALVAKLRETVLARTVPAILERAMPYFSAKGIAKPTLSYREMRSRWGSCHTKKKHITLAKALAQCPVSCVEYVVAHELTHLIHPNHSRDFYRELTKIMPDWKSRREALRGFPTE